MSPKPSVHSKASCSEPKRQRKMLTVSKKVRLLNMPKVGRRYADVGNYYGINESIALYVKKDEKNMMATAKVTFNKAVKRVLTSRDKTIIRVESTGKATSVDKQAVVSSQIMDGNIKRAAECAEEGVYLKGCLTDLSNAIKDPSCLVGRKSTFYPWELGTYVEEFCRELKNERVRYDLIAGDDSSWGKPTVSVRGYGLVVMFGHGDVVEHHKRDQAQQYADESGQKCTFIFFGNESRIPIIDTFHP